jgi:23S rRNA pseudouridine2605 synthase
MRINRYIAQASGLSRRAADQAIAEGRVLVNGAAPEPGHQVAPIDTVTLDGRPLSAAPTQTILLNKPVGYVVSRDGQGSDTVYSLLPPELQTLKPIGRLDKFSSGLLLLTNDGTLAQELTHPKHQKVKIYQIKLSQPLQPLHRQMIQDHGVLLEDGPSRFELERLPMDNEGKDSDDSTWQITMREGRNRQIRRTFLALGYGVSTLHRIQFGEYTLGNTPNGKYTLI